MLNDDIQRIALAALGRVNEQMRANNCTVAVDLHSIESVSEHSFDKPYGSAGRLLHIRMQTVPLALFDIAAWQRAYGAFLWNVAFTGDVDIEHVQRIDDDRLCVNATAARQSGPLTTYSRERRVSVPVLPRHKIGELRVLVTPWRIRQLGCVRDDDMDERAVGNGRVAKVHNRLLPFFIGHNHTPQTCVEVSECLFICLSANDL